ncbi:MAG: hypothetical protein ACREBV_06565 [Candidatus Zixiibacteriota bacterium]
MQITRSFEGQNIPTFPIAVAGPMPSTFGTHDFVAGIDTGFSGFLSLPFLGAIKSALIFGGVMPLTLADGSTQPFLYCVGEVKVQTKSAIGLILVSRSNDVLAGMEFLKLLGLRLIVDPTTNVATLTDEVTFPPPATEPPA